MRKLLVFACIAGMSAPSFCASDVEKLDARINDSQAVVQEIMATPDKAIPDSITKKAVCIGVIPEVKKGFSLSAECMARVSSPATRHTAGVDRFSFA
jgi:SH3 domain-containing YSC84-like protein 1